MKIGVLALQGDFDAHRKRLEALGAKVVLVKKPEQLDDIAGLVIPGGESSTFLKLLGEDGLAKLKDFVRVKPTFGTCAGAILLANEVENPKQAGLGALDITIRRNAYGRQVDSSIREGQFLNERFSNSPILLRPGHERQSLIRFPPCSPWLRFPVLTSTGIPSRTSRSHRTESLDFSSFEIRALHL